MYPLRGANAVTPEKSNLLFLVCLAEGRTTGKTRMLFGTESDRIILRLFLRPENGQFSPHFGAISLLNCKENLEKKEKNPLEKIQKIQWRNFPEIADFCPLSWSNVS